MNTTILKKLIKEAVREAVREELRQVLAEHAAAQLAESYKTQLIESRQPSQTNFKFTTENIDTGVARNKMDKMFGKINNKVNINGVEQVIEDPNNKYKDDTTMPKTNPFNQFIQQTMNELSPGELSRFNSGMGVE